MVVKVSTLGRLAALGVVGALGACALSAAAPVRRDDTPPEIAAIEQALTAARLADWSRRAGDPQGLIVAARMLGEIPFRAAEIDGTAEGGEDSDRERTPADPLSIAALLDEARDLARGDAALLEEIDAAEAAATRGVVNSPFGKGPIATMKDVRARETYWFQVQARNGEVLRVAAVGDGDTNIDLIIQDSGGTALCDDADGDHYPVCTITPARQGMLKVNIVNRGAVWTKVRILSN